jgi:NTP pyrophosphatase (non-canonical NTP hydrolase)
MQINDYSNWTENTCAKLENQTADILHMLLGIATESGELADVFKKNIAYNKSIDWVNVQEEIGDLMFYIASFCRICDLNLQDIIDNNVKKLETRYPDKFSAEKAINRNLEKERKILEELGY